MRESCRNTVDHPVRKHGQSHEKARRGMTRIPDGQRCVGGAQCAQGRGAFGRRPISSAFSINRRTGMLHLADTKPHRPGDDLAPRSFLLGPLGVGNDPISGNPKEYTSSASQMSAGAGSRRFMGRAGAIARVPDLIGDRPRSAPSLYGWPKREDRRDGGDKPQAATFRSRERPAGRRAGNVVE